LEVFFCCSSPSSSSFTRDGSEYRW
jgi:hypothetical protein